MTIKIDNCQSCPFCNDDNEFGKDRCNLNKDIFTSGYKEMLSDKIHKDCPLIGNSVIVFDIPIQKIIK